MNETMDLYESNELRATKQWPYAVSAGCVVYRFDSDSVEVLLLERFFSSNPEYSSGVNYNLPKGHVAREETLESAAIRETEEEAGCKVVVQTYLGALVRDFTHPSHGVYNDKTVHYFAGLWQDDLEGIDSEHDSRSWFGLDEAIKLLRTTNERKEEYLIVQRLQKFLELKNAA